MPSANPTPSHPFGEIAGLLRHTAKFFEQRDAAPSYVARFDDAAAFLDEMERAVADAPKREDYANNDREGYAVDCMAFVHRLRALTTPGTTTTGGKDEK